VTCGVVFNDTGKHCGCQKYEFQYGFPAGSQGTNINSFKWQSVNENTEWTNASLDTGWINPLIPKLSRGWINCKRKCNRGEVRCWGGSHRVLLPPAYLTFKRVVGTGVSMCGLVKGSWKGGRIMDGSVFCWGKYKSPGGDWASGSNLPFWTPKVQFKSLSLGGSTHICGVVWQDHGESCNGKKCARDDVLCAGPNSVGQAKPPSGLNLAIEPSCKTQHPMKKGPTACTSCGKNISFTILDPKTNTGTCTIKECPFCKPKQCCGPRHKHYVVNTESLEGVCVRHNDDCTPVCMPVDDDKPGQRRVCTKGCNQLVKVSRDASKRVNFAAALESEAQLFDIVVCQADKRVMCDGYKPGEDHAQCSQQKWVKPVALCKFSVALWNLGGTCIANHVDGEKHPQCAETLHASEAVKRIRSECRPSTQVDEELCQKTPNAKNCVAVSKEESYCTRLGMSY